MKIVITGHANGIGKSIYKKFSDCGWEVSGYDILNNSDVTLPQIQETLLEELLSADVFVNNALSSQTELLIAAHKQWLGQQKTIVNISSAMTYMYVNNDYPESFTDYYNHKQTLDNQTRVLQKQTRYPKIINFRPAWVDTQLADGVTDYKMKPEHLADLIYFCVENSEHQQFLDVVIR
jgi:short-subunit dehydrogenase involved in D-alanine esterification of teichoic acids